MSAAYQKRHLGSHASAEKVTPQKVFLSCIRVVNMASLILGCGAFCFNSSSKEHLSKKRLKKTQEFEKQRLANEERVKRLSHEGLIQVPPGLGFTPPPSYENIPSVYKRNESSELKKLMAFNVYWACKYSGGELPA
ncbi:uncharacterized protein LAJ45_08388 [Morchella importuna]|uniref:uncharacterized protein n=1 Tax=Morchella importuna TaxID=1174673 RepID=UPI001E8DF972|nr:uncharacterized protein LAJ45_08388 [Morchella importuna]KAH8147561.1 hypothetical protein LAJ45_08388 [Morchella importuna]